MNALKTTKHLAILLTLLLGPLAAQALEEPTKERRDEVAKRGAQVMPFSLEQTRHVFTKTARGGVQQVVAKDGTEGDQVNLIRQHLAKIAQAFSHGDFSDPAKIHGDAMPGLAELRSARPGQLEIKYREIPNGAEIDYQSADAAMVAAIHRWFDAQLSDHGQHAMPGHRHHHEMFMGE